MSLSPRQPEALSLPVTEALGRVCDMVERDGDAWRVGEVEAGATAESLAEALYARWYMLPAVSSPSCESDPPLQRSSLLPALRAAHAGASGTSTGWTVLACGSRGVLSAVRDGRSRILHPGQYRMPLRPGVPAAPGEPVEPLASNEHLDAESAIWWSFGESLPEPPTGRLYLNVRPATAPRAIREVTATLLREAFQMKCPIFAPACERVDAVVVYHRRSDRARLLDALLARWARLGPLLDPAVPPLTCPVRPGLAWADDFGGGRSYGESRCQALATTIDGAGDSWGASEHGARLELLVDGLRRATIDPARPWREAS